MDPASALLILILSNDPAAKPEVDAVASRLQRIDHPPRVVLGADALKVLQERGASDGDLVADGTVGKALTKRDLRLAVVRVERRPVGTDVVIESRVWAGGEADIHVAIIGRPTGANTPAEEPVDQVAHGVGGILARWLAENGSGASAVDSQLTALADERDWAGILTRTESLAQPTARQLYYRILAFARLDRLAEAQPVFDQLRRLHPNHLLVDAGDALVHPVPAGSTTSAIDINEGHDPEDDGSNTLR